MTHSQFPIASHVRDCSSIVKDLKILIIYTRWNSDITTCLLRAVIDTLKAYNISRIFIESVPGSFELPYAVKHNCSEGSIFDAIIPIGVLIKGETKHFEYISETVTNALMKVGLECSMPVIFGVLTCLTFEQARQRAGMKVCGLEPMESLGVSWAHTAVEMGLMKLNRSVLRTHKDLFES